MIGAALLPGPWCWELHPATRKPIALASQSVPRDALLATGDEEGSWIEAGEPELRAIEATPAALETAERVYLALLRLPMGAARLALQGEMSALRDYIALARGWEPLAVQDRFETMASGAPIA